MNLYTLGASTSSCDFIVSGNEWITGLDMILHVKVLLVKIVTEPYVVVGYGDVGRL